MPPPDPYDLLLAQINRLITSVDTLRDQITVRFSDLDDRYPTKTDLAGQIALVDQRHNDHVRQSDMITDGLEKELLVLQKAQEAAAKAREENRRWLIGAVVVPILAVVLGVVAANGWHF